MLLLGLSINRIFFFNAESILSMLVPDYSVEGNRWTWSSSWEDEVDFSVTF